MSYILPDHQQVVSSILPLHMTMVEGDFSYDTPM